MGNLDLDATQSMSEAPRRELVEILEAYLADLERGVAPDHEQLLAAHPELAHELRPYLDSLRILDGAARELRGPRAGESSLLSDAQPAKSRQLGDYRIGREIGRGGMGVVYEAHQKSLNRRVALKILPFAAVLDERQIARFRNEAQAAAQLHHPHIVPVFAVGQEQGVYYYAMQYIDGQSLEQAIAELRRNTVDGAGASTRAAGAMNGSTTTIHQEAASLLTSHRSIRSGDFFHTVARLGKEAAEALQHAHEFGIVHRDIKPSNLLVDHRGKLWVTDFGLARVQSDSGVTLTGDVVGTLRYMSPEQASGQGGLIDARTDVYSLGVTLYELLTLEQAFGGEDRHDVMHQIERHEPKPPRQINPAVPIDLETIVLQAMAQSRDERYATAQALADDLERFLSGKPTKARRPTLVDRAAKWARRHRSIVAVAAAACVLLTIVSTAGMLLLVQARERTRAALADSVRQGRAARANFEKAELHFRQARDAVDQFGMRFSDRLVELPGAEQMRRQLLSQTLDYYRRFIEEAGDDTGLQHELALAHFKSGVIAAKLGARDEAIDQYKSAGSLLKQRIDDEPRDAKLRQQLALTHNNLGLLLAARGETDAARAEHESAIVIQQRLVAQHPYEPEYASQLAESNANLGMLYEQLDNPLKAEHLLRNSIDVLRPVAESLSDQPKYSRNLAIACNNLSYVLRKRDVDAAEDAVLEAITILERLTARYGEETQFQDDLALCYNNLAALESQAGHTARAIESYMRAISVQEKLQRKAPAVVRHRSDLAITLNNVGVAHCRANEPDAADAAFRRAREIFMTLAADYPDELAYRGSLAALLNNQALALASAGRHGDAIETYRQALQAQRDSFADAPTSDVLREALSKTYYNYGRSLQHVGRLDDAARVALQRRDLWEGDGPRLVGVAAELAEIVRTMNNDSDAASSMAITRQELEQEIMQTLIAAAEQGLPADVNLAADARFAGLDGIDKLNHVAKPTENTAGTISPSGNK